MAFAQITCRSSLRDIEACPRARSGKPCHMGIRGTASRNNLANANQARDRSIHADFAQHLIQHARGTHADDTLPGLDFKDTVYALDFCLSLFPWARFRKTKGAVKLHTLLDLHGNTPAFIHMSDGKLHDVNVLDVLVPDAGAFHVMDRACLDFERLHRLHLCGSLFFPRAKSNTRLRRLSSRPVDRSTGLFCDPVVRAARELGEAGEFMDTLADTPVEVCETRDPTGICARARVGELVNAVDIVPPTSEPPEEADPRINQTRTTFDESADRILRFLQAKLADPDP